MSLLSQTAARLLIVLIMISVIATAIVNKSGQKRPDFPSIGIDQKNNCLSIAFSRIRDRLEEAAMGETGGSGKIDIRRGIFSDTLTISAGNRQVSYFLGQGPNQGILIESVEGREMPVCATVESFRCSITPGDSIKIEVAVKSTEDSGTDKASNGRRFASLNFGLR